MAKQMMNGPGRMMASERMPDPETELYQGAEVAEGETEKGGIIVLKSEIPGEVEVGTRLTLEVAEDMGDHVRLMPAEETPEVTTDETGGDLYSDFEA